MIDRMGTRTQISSLVTIFGIISFAMIMRGQDVLEEDIFSQTHWFDVTHMEDTLRNHGCTIHFTTGQEGRSSLMEMDIFWIMQLKDSIPPYLGFPYTQEEVESIVHFSQQGGTILFFPANWMQPVEAVDNGLLYDSRWKTTVYVENSNPLPDEGRDIYDIFVFSPITDFVDSMRNENTIKPITCGNHAYPFVFLENEYFLPIAAISYPFLHQGNYESKILIAVGSHMWETWWHDPIIWDNMKFVSNILCTAAGCEGYELPPCAVPEPFEIGVDSVPECANPGDTITLTGRNLWQGSNENIGGDIEIYFYGPQDTVVIPFEYSDHRPDPHSLYGTWLKFVCPALPEGEYDVELGHKAITFYAGKITIPCDSPVSLCRRSPNPFTPNGDGINDEAEFSFPGLGEVEGVIKIFTLGNLKVREIEIPAGWSAKETAIWDGTDNAGEPLSQGIYIYTIRSEGRIKCKGTVTLAR